jgi:hypothetical protein
MKGVWEMKVKSGFCEENLYPLWENFCGSQSWSNDLRLQGLGAGRLNLFEGPDFQGADFELDGKIYHGDVEIHRTSNEWYQHHHHLDRRYNAVQLHLVWHEQPDVSIYTSEKRGVMTLDIKKLSPLPAYPFPKVNCRSSEFNLNATNHIIKQLSLERLKYKTTRIKNLVKGYSYDQVIFLLLMKTLGSPNNSLNFEYFASSLPWEEIIKIRKSNQLSMNDWIRFLLAMSGLKKTNLTFPGKSDSLLQNRMISKAPPLSSSNWQSSGQRPQNHPVEHLNILGNWIYTFPNDSLYFTLKGIFTRREPVKHLLIKTENIFSSKNTEQRNKSLRKENIPKNGRWGRSKIIEIIGNALIPFFYWEALMNSSFGFQEYLKDIYFALPQLNRYAKLKDFEKIFSNNEAVTRKFYIYQGLLYLHQQYCIKNDCAHCPIVGQHKEIDKNFENI